MLQCWSEHAKSRPSFAELYEKLDGFLSAETALVIYFNSLVNFKNRLHKQIQDCNTQSLCTQFTLYYSNGLFREGVFFWSQR